MPNLSHLPILKIVCVDHPGGPLVLQDGEGQGVPVECTGCLGPRLRAAQQEHHKNSTAWQRRRAQTPEQIAVAPDPFRGFRDGE